MNTIDMNAINAEKLKMLHRDDANHSPKSALEQIKELVDINSFVEMYAFLCDENEPAGMTAGYACINQRPVYIFAQDYAVNYAALNVQQAKKICKIISTALQTATPVIAILNSAGVSLNKGMQAMEAYSQIAQALSTLQGICPSIAIISGECYGANAVLSQLFNITIGIHGQTKLGYFSPQIYNAQNGTELTDEELVGTNALQKQGAFTLTAQNLQDAFATCKHLLSLLPDCNTDKAFYQEGSNLNLLLEDSAFQNSNNLISQLTDTVSAIELYPAFENSIRTVIARIGGHSVAINIIENFEVTGNITSKALEKAAKFVSFADNFNLPILTLIDSNEFEALPANSLMNLITAQTKYMYQINTAIVPKICVVLGNAIGQIYATFASKSYNDVCYCLPHSIFAPLQPEAAVQIICQEEIKNSTANIETAKSDIIDNYTKSFASSIANAKLGLVDDVIDPKELRKHVISSLEMLETKSVHSFYKKHGNLPL